MSHKKNGFNIFKTIHVFIAHQFKGSQLAKNKTVDSLQVTAIELKHLVYRFSTLLGESYWKLYIIVNTA